MMLEASGHTGRVTFDGRLVRVVRDTRNGRMTARVNSLEREVVIPLEDIRGLRWRASRLMSNGHLGFDRVGRGERPAGFDVFKDPCTVLFMRSQSASKPRSLKSRCSVLQECASS